MWPSWRVDGVETLGDEAQQVRRTSPCSTPTERRAARESFDSGACRQMPGNALFQRQQALSHAQAGATQQAHRQAVVGVEAD